MENLFETIRAAVANDATDDAKAAGAAACRTILTALEGKADEPIAPPIPDVIANTVAMLRGVPPDQLLDLAITRLRAALPAGTNVAPAQQLKFQIIPVHPHPVPREAP